MLKTPQNIIIRILKARLKKTVIIGGILGFLGLIIPLFSADAIGLSSIVSIGKDVAVTLATGFINIILNLILVVVNAIFLLVVQILKWVYSNPFGSYTNPSTNPVIAIGWTLMRDLVNSLLILVLAYVGLATALNLSGFNTKKTFASVLLVALLVNFTPVIAGVIVDVSNMLMKFFLDSVDFSTMVNAYKNGHSLLKGILSSLFTLTGMIRVVLLIFYGIVGSFILGLFTLLFLMRIFFIWFLVIFSPLAFLAWALRNASSQMASIWSKWWTWFLQWSFVGVPATFFLYLGQQTLARSEDIIKNNPDIGEGFWGGIAPSMIALVMMGIGFVMSLQISAVGAGAVTSLGRRAKDWAQKTTKTKAKDLGAGAKNRAKEVGMAVKNRIGRVQSIQEASTRLKRFSTENKLGRWLSKPVRYNIRYSTRKTRSFLAERKKKRLEEIKNKVGTTPQAQFDALYSFDPEKAIMALLKTIETGQTADVRALFANEEEANEKFKRIMKRSLRHSPETFKKFARVFPELAQQLLGKTADEVEKTLNNIDKGLAKKLGLTAEELKNFADKDGENALLNSLLIGAKKSDIENWDTSTMITALDSEVFHKKVSPGQISKMAEKFEKRFLDLWKEKAFTKEFYDEHNPELSGFIQSTSARSIGINFGRRMEGEKTKEDKEVGKRNIGKGDDQIGKKRRITKP